MTSRYYINGNQVNNNVNQDWSGISYDGTVYNINGERYSLDTNHYYGDTVNYVKNTSGNDCVRIKLDAPVLPGEVTTHAAPVAFDKVLAYAGASLHRDDVDIRYADEALNGTATFSGSVTKKLGRIDLVSDVNGYTEENFPTGSRPDGFDTDQDGMPDEWETANGLNPNDADDANLYTLDSQKQWYTNVEVYLNSLVEDIMKAGNTDAESTFEEYYPQWKDTEGNIHNDGASAIHAVNNQHILVAVSYYNLNGQKLQKPEKGVNIRKEVFSDGTCQSSAFLVK